MAIRNLYSELLELVPYDRRFKSWVKRVEAVDRSGTNGGAFEGEFLPEGTVEVEGPAVFLVHTKTGSRKYQTGHYHVILLDREGNLRPTGIQTTDTERGWALRIRDAVADLVDRLPEGEAEGEAEAEAVDLSKVPTEALIAELRRRGWHTPDVA